MNVRLKLRLHSECELKLRLYSKCEAEIEAAL